MRDLGTRFWVLIDYVNGVPLKQIAHRRGVHVIQVSKIAHEEFAPPRYVGDKPRKKRHAVSIAKEAAHDRRP